MVQRQLHLFHIIARISLIHFYVLTLRALKTFEIVRYNDATAPTSFHKASNRSGDCIVIRPPVPANTMPESIDDSGDGGGGVTEPRKLAARPKSPDVAPCSSSADDLSTAAVGSTVSAIHMYYNMLWRGRILCWGTSTPRASLPNFPHLFIFILSSFDQ